MVQRRGGEVTRGGLCVHARPPVLALVGPHRRPWGPPPGLMTPPLRQQVVPHGAARPAPAGSPAALPRASSALTKLPNGCQFRWGTVGGWASTRLLLVVRFWALWGVR